MIDQNLEASSLGYRWTALPKTIELVFGMQRVGYSSSADGLVGTCPLKSAKR
jgi:hypothetical protein